MTINIISGHFHIKRALAWLVRASHRPYCVSRQRVNKFDGRRTGEAGRKTGVCKRIPRWPSACTSSWEIDLNAVSLRFGDLSACAGSPRSKVGQLCAWLPTSRRREQLPITILLSYQIRHPSRNQRDSVKPARPTGFAALGESVHFTDNLDTHSVRGGRMEIIYGGALGGKSRVFITQTGKGRHVLSRWKWIFTNWICNSAVARISYFCVIATREGE